MWNCLFVFFYNFFRFCGVECGVEIKKKAVGCVLSVVAHVRDFYAKVTPQIQGWALAVEK